MLHLSIYLPSPTNFILSYGTALCFYKHSQFSKTWEQTKLKKKNPPTNVGDSRNMGSIPGLGSSPGGGHGNPLQYFSLENPMDRGAWRATVNGVTKSQTRLRWLNTVRAKKNTEVGCCALLQGIFPTQGSNPCRSCLLHWQAGSLPLVLGSTYRYMNIYIQVHTYVRYIYNTHIYNIC